VQYFLSLAGKYDVCVCVLSVVLAFFAFLSPALFAVPAAARFLD
jgi:hypothetical protein